MANSGFIQQINAPPKGLLTRLKITVMVAATTATNARIIITEKVFNNDVAGFSALKSNPQFHVWDSDIGGTLNIPISTTGVKKDRIFDNGGLDYENRDNEGNGTTTGWTAPSQAKNAFLYAYVELDGVETALQLRLDVKTRESA